MTTLDTHNLIVCFQSPILKISLNLEQYWIPIIKFLEKPENKIVGILNYFNVLEYSDGW